MERLLSDEGRTIFEVVNFVIICGIVGLLGIIANIINITIFCRQGFVNTVNIAFVGLAISDICCLITLEWISICMNPFFASSDLPWILPDVMYLSGAWPHVCFGRITSFITVYITAERYLSIAYPLKIKQIVTPKRTVLIIIVIYFVNIFTLVPEYATSYLGWRYAPQKNNTLIGLVFTTSRKNVEGLCYVLHSILSTTSFFGVIIFTIILAIELRKSSKWRRNATSGKNEAESNRSQKTIKMVVFIAIVLIVCYTPGAIIAMATFLVGPEFSIMGTYINICVAAWSIAYSFQALNSSVNIILYYRMSSKYRNTFRQIFRKCPIP